MTSRVSDRSLQSVTMRHLQSNLEAVEEARARISTGLRIRKPSDDPEGATRVMQLESRLRGIDQRRSNIQAGRRRLSTEEGVLSQLSNILTRAEELAMREAGDTATAESREQAKKEVDSLLETVKSLGNTTKMGDAYLFGGKYADQKPVKDDGSMPADTPSGTHEVRVGESRTVKTNHDAKQVFFDSDVISSLQDLSTALGNNDSTAIEDAAGKVEGAFDQVQELLGEVGARMKELDSAESTLGTLESNFKKSRSDTEGVAIEKAVTELANRQTALQSAMFAISKTQSSGLVQFLR